MIQTEETASIIHCQANLAVTPRRQHASRTSAASMRSLRGRQAKEIVEGHASVEVSVKAHGRL